MELYFYFSLGLLGALFGSFASVVIYRLKSGEKGIMTGRSHCGSCNKILQALDLVPIFSWALHKGKCRFCKSQVSSVYLWLEITMGIIFAAIGFFLIDPFVILMGDGSEIIRLLFWLTIGFISVVYTFYDILFLEIHEGVMFSGVLIMFLGLVTQNFYPELQFFDTIPSIISQNSILIQSTLLASAIIAALYAIMTKELHEAIDTGILLAIFGALYLFGYYHDITLGDVGILNGLIGALGIFTFFFLQILISRGAWMGGGDLRIAIMIGLGLGITFAAAGTMATYLIGSVIGMGVIILAKIKNKGKSLDTQIPFGPFLAAGFFITIFYQNEIMNFIERYF